MASPETPFLLTGVVVVATAVKRDGKLSTTAFQGALAALVLVVLASLTSRTRAAGVVQAIGVLLLISTLILAVKVWNTKTAPSGNIKTNPNRTFIRAGGGGW